MSAGDDGPKFRPTTGRTGADKNKVINIKVGLLGESEVGKTSLMVKYVENTFDEDYVETLGVNFMEKTISIRQNKITFSIWDLGGKKGFADMLPLVCNDAVAILFMFDLSRKSSLNSIKTWYRQAREVNKTAIPFLIGTKYDIFAHKFSSDEQEEITRLARRYAAAMKASLIFCSAQAAINVQKIFKIVLAKAFKLPCSIPLITNVGEPILEYTNPPAKTRQQSSSSNSKSSRSSASPSSSSSSSSSSGKQQQQQRRRQQQQQQQ
jgi:Gtp-binding protein of the ras superfamily involved in termination of M-phase